MQIRVADSQSRTPGWVNAFAHVQLRERACARAPVVCPLVDTFYAEHNLMILDQLRPREFKGGYATTYGGCLAAPIGVLCLVVYRVDLLRRSVCSASVAGAVECWFGSRFDEARIG